MTEAKNPHEKQSMIAMEEKEGKLISLKLEQYKSTGKTLDIGSGS